MSAGEFVGADIGRGRHIQGDERVPGVGIAGVTVLVVCDGIGSGDDLAPAFAQGL